MRTISEISHHLVSLEETFSNSFIPVITVGHICNETERKPLSLPTHFGGLAIHKHAEVNNSNSKKRTAQLTPLIKNQIKQYTVDKNQIKITKQVIKKARSMPRQLKSVKK